MLFFSSMLSHGTFSSSIVLGNGPEHASVCGREVCRAAYRIKSLGTKFSLVDVIGSLKGLI